MTKPREVIPGRSYMFTRRCSERRFFLRPSKETNQAIAYCYGVAAQERNIDLFWLSSMSNHNHCGGEDQKASYSEFLRYAHSLLARCMNVRLCRWEKFWSDEQTNVVHLADAETLFEKMVYCLTNPVKDHLVDKVFNWPGVNSLRHQLSGTPMVVQRPSWFFDPEGKMPEQVEIHFKRPQQFAHLTEQQWRDKLRKAVETVEHQAAQERRDNAAVRIMGRKAILRQSPFSSPKTRTRRRGLKPTLASRDKQRRADLLKAHKRFQQRYRHAYQRLRAGERDVLFPYGTYKLRVQNLVQVEPPPPRGLLAQVSAPAGVDRSARPALE